MRSGNGVERRIVDAFHETVSKCVQGGPERLNFMPVRDVFLNGSIDRPIVNERAARSIDKVHPIVMSRPQFGDLAQTTGDGALMTLHAGLCVIDRPKSLIDGFALFEHVAIMLEL